MTKATTLYAHFTAKVLTVTLNARGGVVAKPTVQVTYAKTYSPILTPTRAGYTFNGWFTKASGGTKVKSSTKVTITSNQTLYAHWTAKKYKTSFNAAGGTSPKVGKKVTKSKTVTFGKKYGTLPKSTRTGYTFAGWWTDRTGGSKVAAATVVKTAAPVTLYAHWTAKAYTVKFDYRSGVVLKQSMTVRFGQVYGDLPEPTRTGYTFAGWWTKASGGTEIKDSTIVKITATQTLYAHWTLGTGG